MNEPQELIELVRSIVLEVSEKPLARLALETPIAEIGIDSVSLAEIVGRIEERLGVEVPASQWVRVRTLQDFVDAIEQARRR